MSPKVTVAGVEFDVGFDENLNIIAAYECPNCQASNQVNLSETDKGDKIPCASCGIFALDIADSGFRQLRESIDNLKRTFGGFKK